MALSDHGRRPVVVIAGNHDSPGFFEALAPFLRRAEHPPGREPSSGPTRVASSTCRHPGAGRSSVAFPFLREGRAFHVWEPTEEHYKKYADRLRAISEAYSRYADELAGTDAVTLLVAHFFVGGAKVHGHGAPRGERELHMGEAYTATPEAIPPGPQYVALGHIHAPQPVPGAKVPAEYAGSLLELDFGEAGEQKRVVIVEAEPGLSGERALDPAHRWSASGPSHRHLAGRAAARRCSRGVPRPHRRDRRARSRAGRSGPRRVRLPRQGARRVSPCETERPDESRGGRSLDELYAVYYQERERRSRTPS